MSAGMWQWLAQGDSVTKGTAAVMLVMSVLSWVVIVFKLWFMASAHRSVPKAIEAFWQMPNIAQAQAQVKTLDRQALVLPMAEAINQPGAATAGPSLAQNAAQGQRLMRSLRSALGGASRQLQWGQTLLATIGATAPFVGLLGTVWGIYRTLTTVAADGQMDINAIVGPVGEALIMTAFGLAVALPALFAYNFFSRKNQVQSAEIDAFAHDLVAEFSDNDARA